MKLDLFDGITLIGFVLLVTGIGILSIPAALMTGGAGLIAAGIFGAQTRAQRGGK